MRPRHATISVLLSILLLGLTIPTASAGAVRTEFAGFVFPAGMFDPEVGASCVAAGGTYVTEPLPGCVLDPGTTRELGDGRLLIRDEVVRDSSYAWHSATDALSFLKWGQPLPDEPRRTGYNVETFNANFDATMSGPVWGSWDFYSFGDELMFTGTFTGSFDKGKPTIRAVGIGVDAYKGQHVWMNVVDQVVNMYGHFLTPGA